MTGKTKERLIGALLVAALVVALVPALVQLGWHLRLFAGRAGFPLDLEWMEGGMLVHAQRIAAGQGIYVKPSLDFVPYLYTPLYPALLALLSFVFPLGYLLGRMVSLLAFFSSLVLLGALVASEARGLARGRRSLAALVGLVGAAAVTAAFAFTGSFFDLARSDSLLLALEALALWLALRGGTWKSAAAAGLVIAAAFFSKQTASIIGVGLGVGLLIVNWRRGLVYGGVAAVVLAAGIGLLVKTSDGWFWTYIFKLHQSHGYRWAMVPNAVLPDTLKHLWPVFAVLIVATVALACSRMLRRSDIILWVVALAGEVAAAVGFSTQWGSPTPTFQRSSFPCWPRPCCPAGCCCMRSTAGAGYRPYRLVWSCWAWPGRTSTSRVRRSRLRSLRQPTRLPPDACSSAWLACPAISSFRFTPTTVRFWASGPLSIAWACAT